MYKDKQISLLIENEILKENLSDNLHLGIDVLSMLVDFATVGTGGAIIDFFHALSYFIELQFELDQDQKDALLINGLITLGSIFLPAIMQSVSPILKNMVKFTKTGNTKLLKRINKEQLDMVMEFVKLLRTELDQIAKAFTRGVAPSKNNKMFKKILEKFRKPNDKLPNDEVLEYFELLNYLSNKIIGKDIITPKVLIKLYNNKFAKYFEKNIIKLLKSGKSFFSKFYKKVRQYLGFDTLKTLANGVNTHLKNVLDELKNELGDSITKASSFKSKDKQSIGKSTTDLKTDLTKVLNRYK